MKIFKVQTASFIDNMWEGGHVGTKLPYPFFVDEKGMVQRQDLWDGDPLRAVGFQKDLAVMQIDLWWKDAIEDLSLAIGMYLVTANKTDDYGVHQTAVEKFEVVGTSKEA